MPGLAAVILIILTASTARAQETRMVPVTVDGERVRLQMRVYEPTMTTPAPTLVFNHEARRARSRSARATAQPMTRPPITRIESPVT
jgi:hypothetical protein